MQEKIKNRKQLGAKLAEIRTSKGLTMYRVERAGKLEFAQVKSVESGERNYTIDILLKYLDGIGETIESVFKN